MSSCGNLVPSDFIIVYEQLQQLITVCVPTYPVSKPECLLQLNGLRECWMKNVPSLLWLNSLFVCGGKLRCQIIFLQSKCPLMVFSPREFDAGRRLICCMADKIRWRRQVSAVICFSNRNSLINAKAGRRGIYSNGGHNSSFLLASASSLLSS